MTPMPIGANAYVTRGVIVTPQSHADATSASARIAKAQISGPSEASGTAPGGFVAKRNEVAGEQPELGRFVDIRA